MLCVEVKIPSKGMITLSSLTLHCHLHPLQAANCCRNSRLVVDEDDLLWFKKKENCHVFVNEFHGNFRCKKLGCRKIPSVFRDVKLCLNASRGLKGLKLI